MRVINLREPFDRSQLVDTPVALAMGYFDGVHRGHQVVLEKAKELARQNDLKFAVLTYDHKPSIVFTEENNQCKNLSTLPRKLELLEQIGADIVYVVSFTSKLAMLKPDDFINKYVVAMQAQFAVAGFDHTFGPKTLATMDYLKQIANNRFQVVTIPEQMINQQKISSSHIRQALDGGKMNLANEMLGYAYQTTGVVIHGLARGRTLGYPTANVAGNPNEWLPNVGVYAVKIQIGTTWFTGMASIGYNVTFVEDTGKTLEVNIFDFHDEIYGENVKVQWLHYLRPEIKFNSGNELVTQLAKDEWNARSLLRSVNYS